MSKSIEEIITSARVVANQLMELADDLSQRADHRYQEALAGELNVPLVNGVSESLEDQEANLELDGGTHTPQTRLKNLPRHYIHPTRGKPVTLTGHQLYEHLYVAHFGAFDEYLRVLGVNVWELVASYDRTVLALLIYDLEPTLEPKVLDALAGYPGLEVQFHLSQLAPNIE